VANALLVGERRRRSTPADTVQWMVFLRSLPVMIDEEGTTRAWTETLTLARTHGLSAYDAAYVELAVRRGLALATLDRSLAKAARQAGVARFVAA
jgi:predicted nucleic acid-binding protein